MIDINDVKPGMPVVCLTGDQFAIVDHMEGEGTIKLKKDHAGLHHFIPVKWVRTITNGQIHVDRPGTQATEEWWTSPREKANHLAVE